MIIPDYYHKSVIDISPDFLREKGIRGLIVDVDNTICAYQVYTIPLPIKEWLSELEQAEIAVCLVSNGGKHRIRDIAQEIDLPYLARAGKPGKRGYIKASHIMDLPIDHIAVIGDQLFTDIWGAQRIGMLSFLVEPVDREHEALIVKIKRPFENLLLSKYFHSK